MNHRVLTVDLNFLAGLELLKVSIAQAGYTDKVEIGMDVAASGTAGLTDFYFSLVMIIITTVSV